jgi:hypothetical protein
MQAAEHTAKKFRDWRGRGDYYTGEYNVKTNSIIHGGGNGSPAMLNTGTNSTRLVHKEYIGEVMTGPVAGELNITEFIINPGNVQSFPWGSGVANQYDQWRPNGIIITFQSSATTAVNTGVSLGTVIMASDYDVFDRTPDNAQELLNMAMSQQAKTSESQMHGIECDISERQRMLFYTQSYGTGTNETSRDYSLCKFYVATFGGGLDPNMSVGSLHIHYDIELTKPQMYAGIPAKATLEATYYADLLDLPAMQESKFIFGPLGTIDEPPPVETRVKPTSGRDLGFWCSGIAGSGTFQMSLPTMWAGAYLRMELNWAGALQDALGFNAFLHKGMEAVYPSWVDPWGSTTPPMSLCAPQTALAGTGQQTRVLFFKVDDNLQGPPWIVFNEPFGGLTAAYAFYQRAISFRIVSKFEALGRSF